MRNLILNALLAGSFGLGLVTSRAFAQAEPAAKEPPSLATLFPDAVMAQGKGVKVMQSQVEQMFITFRANRAAVGQQVAESARAQVEKDILEKLIATQLLVSRATEADKDKGKEIAKKFMEEQVEQAPSEDSFNRQLRALGMTPERFREQVFEQALVKAVIDRELQAKTVVTDSEIREFYEKNPKFFLEPELARVAHILFSTKDPSTGQDLPPELKMQKRKQADAVLARAKSGEDFARLAERFTEDRLSKARGGEYTIARAKDDPARSAAPDAPEFEAAAFSLAVGQISDLVTTRYGYHIIKLLEKIPPRQTELSKAEFRIKETLLQEKVQKDLPGFIEKLKQEAGVVYLSENK